MSLTHRAPARLDPRVHYTPVLFEPVQARLAPPAAPKPVGPPLRKPGAPPSSQRAQHLGAPIEVRILCAHYHLKLSSATVVFKLYRAGGALVANEQIHASPTARGNIMADIRSKAPRLAIVSSPNCGYHLAPQSIAALAALFAEARQT